jgi:hypothetical protein
VANSNTAATYNLDELTLNSFAQLQVLGPVVINLANQVTVASRAILGSEARPEWLSLSIAQKGVSLRAGSQLNGMVRAPLGEVEISGQLNGGFAADSLSIGRTGVLRVVLGQPSQLKISDFNPKSAPLGTLINVIGSGFISPAGQDPQVTLNKQGGGNVDAPLSSFTASGLSFVIATGAAAGPLTIKVGSQSATSG